MKLFLASILMLTNATSALADSDWIQIASADTAKWEAKKGSFEFSKTKGGTPIAVVIGRVVDSKKSTIELYKWYVSLIDCSRKMGKIASLKISGEFSFENDFVFESGNVASAMAEFICSVSDYVISENNKKSL